MDVKLVLVNEKEINILESLLQLYLHDISYYFPVDFNSENGKYDYDEIKKYFDETDNHAYFVKKDDNIAGFILVDKNDDTYTLQEMFILNNYKGKGLGEESVRNILDQNKGKWIIKSLPCSPSAERFWIKTVNNYTSGNYEINRVGKYNRAVFTFNNSEII
mgnify:CR=1 FL=1